MTGVEIHDVGDVDDKAAIAAKKARGWVRRLYGGRDLHLSGKNFARNAVHVEQFHFSAARL